MKNYLVGLRISFQNQRVEDENEPDELDDYSDSELTETGYLKDGFVVDDNELESEEYISE